MFMKMRRNLEGETFGELMVLCRDMNSSNTASKSKWRCECSCGKVSSIFEHNLIRGRSTRCNDWRNHPRRASATTSECTLTGDVVVVSCANGTQFIVDVDDFEVVRKRSWFLKNNGYIVTNIKAKKQYIHRLLLGAKEGDEVDHISGDKLDNRKSNLRFCTHAENQRNMNKRSHNKSGYKGVFRAKGRTKYAAQIRFRNHSIYIGTFDSPVEAAQAYNASAAILFGPFSRLNEVPPPTNELVLYVKEKIKERTSSYGYVLSGQEVKTV